MKRNLVHIMLLATAAILLTGCAAGPAPSPIPQPDPLAPTLPAPRYTVTLDPVRAGDLVVSGSGPAGLPIRIVDISQVGYSYGETMIGQGGRFTLQLAEPAIGGNRIGVLLADLAGSKYTPADFGGRDIPLIGLVIASQLVAK